MSIQRYEIYGQYGHDADATENPDGEWVKYEDHEASLKKLNEIVDAWEALPGGRQVRNEDVERWLGKDMAPAINAIREFLGRPKPSA